MQSSHNVYSGFNTFSFCKNWQFLEFLEALTCRSCRTDINVHVTCPQIVGYSLAQAQCAGIVPTTTTHVQVKYAQIGARIKLRVQ